MIPQYIFNKKAVLIKCLLNLSPNRDHSLATVGQALDFSSCQSSAHGAAEGSMLCI